MQVAEGEPSPCYRGTYSVGTPDRAFREKGWQMHCKTMFSPFFRTFLFGKQTDIFLFWRERGVILWMFHIGRTRHPGPGPRVFTPGQLSVEFVNIGGWLTYGDLAVDSCAQFLAIATNFAGLVIILFGLLLVRIGLLVVMLGLGSSVLAVPPFLSHLLLLLSFSSFSRWVVY